MNTRTHTYVQHFESPLRIAMVTETYLPEVNSFAITVARMVEWLRQRQQHAHRIRPRQHKQDVIGQEDGYAEALVAGISLHGYPELKIGVPAKGTLLSLWQKHRPDIGRMATAGPCGTVGHVCSAKTWS